VHPESQTPYSVRVGLYMPVKRRQVNNFQGIDGK
jgi:hypothetical protein